MELLKEVLKKLNSSKTEAIRKNWYKEEAYIQISDKRRKELKEKGFLASTEIMYDFNKYSEKLYVNNRDYHLLHPFSKSTSFLLNNKAYIPCLFSWNRELLPQVSMFVSEGQVVFCTGSKQGKNLKITLLSLLEEYHELFGKKVNGSGGNETFVFTKDTLEKVLLQLNSKQWLINNKISNEEYARQIYENSVNTLRVVFYKNRSGEMKIFRIFHRFGTSESQTVDNCGRGGMVCKVDLETGQLSKALIYGSRFRNGWYSNHVDSLKTLEDTFIPHWREKIHTIKEIVQNLFYLDYGGIDIASTPKGLKVLEINSLPTMLITQMMEPALIDEEFAKFLRGKGYKFSC